MWPDNETEKDFLNFSGVAGTVAEIITQATGRPTSIGISGSWGAGKSSMIKLVRAALAEKDQNDPEQFIYVEFNAWHADSRSVRTWRVARRPATTLHAG